ncbi:hypothetical protein BDR22DRAFT_587238 [Usnea florida]
MLIPGYRVTCEYVVPHSVCVLVQVAADPVSLAPNYKYSAKVHSHDRESILVIQTGHRNFVIKSKDTAGKPLSFEDCIISMLDWPWLKSSSKIQWWQCLDRTPVSLHANCVRILEASSPRPVKGNLIAIHVKDHRVSCPQNGAKGAIGLGTLQALRLMKASKCKRKPLK